MGQQQLLLVVLGMVVVGIAVAVALMMFQSSAVEISRAAITDDLLYFAQRARDYYWRPGSLGGGNRTFLGITSIGDLSKMSQNENARYSIKSVSNDEVIIEGIGKIAVASDTITVQIIVNEKTNTIRVVH